MKDSDLDMVPLCRELLGADNAGFFDEKESWLGRGFSCIPVP